MYDDTQAPSARQPGTAAASQTTGQSATATAAVPTKSSVYFEYDSSAVNEQYRPLVTDHARYLSAHGATHVRVEGNADERGSREYNLALGQRRAEAVKGQLQLLGVPAARIEAISFGEEKPRSDAAEESAYAENRRADIVHAKR